MHVWMLADISGKVPGGMRRHMELHAEGLRRIGHDATLLFSEDFGGGERGPAGRRMPGALSLSALRSRCSRERPDVINVHTLAAPAWIMARRAGLMNAKVVVMSYAADETHITLKRPRDVLRWARVAVPARATFTRADGIWCVNQQDLEFYVSVYGVDRARLTCLPHAVADGFYVETAPVERNPRRLLFVGTWIRRKGSDVLAAIFEQVIRDEPGVEIVLAGTLTGESRIRAELSPAVSEHTRIYDHVTDIQLAQLYRSSGMLLLPSRKEGLPISMLEAMACGCPALAAANSGMLDTIETGRNGWLESSFDPARWAARIGRLLADPAALAAASAAARRTAEEFRVECVAQSVALWYSRLIAGNPSSG